MTDKNTKDGWIFRNGDKSAVYMIPESVKEYEKNITGDGELEKFYSKLIDFWLQSYSHPPSSICKKIKGEKKEGLYELKKSGTQVRLLGYYEGSNFFVLKCIQKKENKLKPEDIQTVKKRKHNFRKEDIHWEVQNE